MDAQDFRSLSEAYIGVYDDDIREKLEFESWVNNLLEEGYDLSDYTWYELYENYSQLDEAIRNLESRKKLRSIMDREVVKGDKSKGQNPRMKYHTKTGDQAFGLLINRDETGSKGNPVRSRGGMADSASPTRDRGAGNKAARKVGKSVPNTRDVDESYDLYDLILSHLIDEGYADTNESALVIMANMSEEWRRSILDEEKKELPQTKMYRKAGELARSGIATGDEGKKKRSAKIVSAITRETERKRFDEIGKSPKHN